MIRRWRLNLMDTDAALRQDCRMKTLVALTLPLLLAACGSSPRSLGITGPGQQPLSAGPSMPTINNQDTNGATGVPTTGTFYGPNNGPTAGGSGYYGYN